MHRHLTPFDDLVESPVHRACAFSALPLEVIELHHVRRSLERECRAWLIGGGGGARCSYFDLESSKYSTRVEWNKPCCCKATCDVF